jgi:biopolymer transport protein ExbB
MNFEMLIDKLLEIWNQALEIWISGGWAMIAIAIIAFVMFALGLNVNLKLSGKGFSIREKKWKRWLYNPNERTGPVGELLNFVTGGTSIETTATMFDEMRASEIAPFERELRVMKICVSAAPLLGLLGTVTGMLATFSALATGSGGDKTMEMVAAGISEALITTETGLVIALPGVFVHYLLVRKLEQYKAFLARIETACTQKMYKEQHRTSGRLIYPDVVKAKTSESAVSERELEAAGILSGAI